MYLGRSASPLMAKPAWLWDSQPRTMHTAIAFCISACHRSKIINKLPWDVIFITWKSWTLYVINVIAQKWSKAYLGVAWPLALVLLELECRLCLVLKSGCLNHRCWLVRDFWSMAKLWLSIADWWHLISKMKSNWKNITMLIDDVLSIVKRV